MFTNCAWKQPKTREYPNNCCIIQEGCWTPCIWYTNLKHGSYASIAYSAILHFLFMVYSVSIIFGDRSAEVYGPFFEYDGDEMLATTSLSIIYCCMFFIFSILLLVGLHSSNRTLFWPWMISTFVEILVMIAFGLWLLAGYWMFYDVIIIATIILFIFCGFHIYTLVCVASQYRLVGNAFKVEVLYPDYDEWP